MLVVSARDRASAYAGDAQRNDTMTTRQLPPTRGPMLTIRERETAATSRRGIAANSCGATVMQRVLHSANQLDANGERES